MHKLETQPDLFTGTQAPEAPRTTATAFHHTRHTLRTWSSKEPFFENPPEPHRVVFWCSPWGVNLTRMVWAFCSLLKWPNPSQTHDPRDLGISWTKLACSFMIWSGRVLPVRIRVHEKLVIVPYCDERVQLLPRHDPSGRSQTTFVGLLNISRHSLRTS